MNPKPAPASHAIHDLIRQRWSPRAFDPSRPVARADLLSLLEAARWSASCFNDQPWRYLICDRFEDAESWQTMLDCLGESNQVWARNAPILLLSVASNHFGHNGNPNRWAGYDTGAATACLSLQAVALGLAVHQMGGFDATKATEAFGLPAESTPMAVLALGYQAAAETLNEALQSKELAPRTRKPLAEIGFWGKWPT